MKLLVMAESPARKTVYFDTNVFAHIQQRNGVSEWDIYYLEKAIKDGNIAVVLSYLNIEETLFLLKTQPKRAEARIKLMLDWADFHLFIKSQELIVNDDIRSYAMGTHPVSAFIEFDPHMEFWIRNMAAPNGSFIVELDELLQEVQHDKDTFRSFLEEARRKILSSVTSRPITRDYQFNQYLQNNSPRFAEGFAERAGALEECRRRGINGLLDIRSIRLAVNAGLSLVYSHIFEGVNPKPGDSRDILHAVLASTADIFVTHDGSLMRVLRRIPMHDFHVTDVKGLLAVLGSPTC